MTYEEYGGDSIADISPGRLPDTLTIEKILTGNSAPRNYFLLKYLDNMKFIDGLGRGVPMMRREMGERLRYQEEGEILRLILDFETPLARGIRGGDRVYIYHSVVKP
ncbi:putative ATP-dependent DNA helicase recG C-terminal [Candidatus Electrothrix marina]|uniref:Putative ATP-dependent DNA helicase recG C-terminal n=1 Tax=Candidatus Electrothrix marina TaxID=1859130 RepID=A0A444JFZ2_9BACT|nr:putative ATP-dependent DNA helicase recG C-terminal [Candidatus Electrothrix marina]